MQSTRPLQHPSAELPAAASVVADGPMREPMFATALSLMTSTVITNGLGVLFWILAARLYAPAAVGRDVALVSLMIELSSLGQLDLANVAVRFLPAVAARRRWVLLAYGAAVSCSAVVAVVTVQVAARLSHSLAFLTADGGLAEITVIATALWSVFAIQDGVLTGLRQARWVPVENAAFGLLKLLALGALGIAHVQHGPFLAFAIPMTFLLLPVNAFVFRRVLPAAPPPTDEAMAGAAFGRRRLLAFVAQDYLGSLLAAAALSVLPLLVVALLDSRSNAFFYLPLLIVLAVDTLFANACTSLIAAGSSDVARQTELARLMARRAFKVLVPAVAVLVLVAPLVLRVFGTGYELHATTLMRLLAAACVPRAAHSLYAALARFRGDGRSILVRQLLSVSVIVCGTVLLAPRMGLDGVGVAWLAASLIVLLTVLPGLWRELR